MLSLSFLMNRNRCQRTISIISGKERTRYITRFFLNSDCIELRGYSTVDCTIDLEVPTFATRRPVVSANENFPEEPCLEWWGLSSVKNDLARKKWKINFQVLPLSWRLSGLSNHWRSNNLMFHRDSFFQKSAEVASYSWTGLLLSDPRWNILVNSCVSSLISPLWVIFSISPGQIRAHTNYLEWLAVSL